jgi:hypothetical protein
VQTQYRQQQVVTYQDVPQTAYRQEAYYETAPVTAYQSTVVDEGSYQQVWVPKLVTKQVPTTIYQQRLGYRTVPYQINQRVAQVHTQVVPQQALGYMPQQITMNGTGYAWGAVAPQSSIATLPPISSGYPATASGIPTMPILTVPSVQTAQVPEASSVQPVPDPRFMEPPAISRYDEWTTVQSRSASNDDRLGGYRVGPSPDSELPTRSANRSGMFVPAPSAATVWQSRPGMSVR